MELDEAAQREAKRVMLSKLGLSVSEVVASPRALGYRHSSKRVVFATAAGPTLGSYAHGSHALAMMPGCLVDHPQLVAAFAQVERAARKLAIEPYDEASRRGDLRYVWAKTNGEEVIVTLISAAAESRVHEVAQELTVAGVLHSIQGGATNALRGASSALLTGKREISLSLLGRALEVGALGFLQPNPAVAEAAYRALIAIDGVAGRELAFDLYAGAGITTRALAASFREVLPCESHPESARALGCDAESAEAFLARMRGRRPDLVIANPPRKGLAAAADALLALGAPCLHIMSCGPEGLARDLATLSARYEVASLQAFDTLPQTAHVELVARLRLRGDTRAERD
jgi:23S rRNA (uracil1939-C5)-methyltransferase